MHVELVSVGTESKEVLSKKGLGPESEGCLAPPAARSVVDQPGRSLESLLVNFTKVPRRKPNEDVCQYLGKGTSSVRVSL